MDNFSINEKIFSITTDNAANMVCFGEMFCDVNENRIHVRCATHILHLVVRAGLDNFSLLNLFEKIRYFCKKVHNSSRLSQYLDSQEQSNSEPTIKVVLDVKTRWNSTHEMLKTAIRIKKSLTAASVQIVSEGNANFCALDENDWIMAQKVCFLLEPFNQGKKSFKLNSKNLSYIFSNSRFIIRKKSRYIKSLSVFYSN